MESQGIYLGMKAAVAAPMCGSRWASRIIPPSNVPSGRSWECTSKNIDGNETAACGGKWSGLPVKDDLT